MAAAYVAPSRREQLQAVLIAALCSLLFLGPGLLPGRALVPYPPELLQPMKAEALQSGDLDLAELARGNSSMGDKYQLSLAWDRILQDHLRRGEIPRWTRDIGGGTSFIPQIPQVYQPWNLLLLIWPSTQIYGIWFLLHQVLLGWFAYLFLRRIGTAHHSALLGMVALVIGMFTQSRVHQQVILSAALPLFPMLLCVYNICRGGGGARPVACLGLASGISWLAAFPIVSLLGTYLAGAYAVFLVLGNRGQRLRPLALCGAGMLLGGALSLCQMIPVLGAMADTARSSVPGDVLGRLVLEWDYLVTVLWPDLLHWPGEHFYLNGDTAAPRAPWTNLLFISRMNESGFNYPETSFAIGIPALLMALLALGNRFLRGQSRFFASAAALAFLAASVPFLAALIPGLSTSDPKRMVFLVAFCLPVLAAIGMDRLSLGSPPRWLQATALTVCGVSALLGAILFLLSPEGFLSLYSHLLAWGPLDEATRNLVETGAHPDAASAIRAQIEAVAHGDEAAVNRGRLLTTFVRAAVISGGVSIALLRRRPAMGWTLIALTALELLHAGHGAVISVSAERVERVPAVLAPIAGLEEGAPGLRPRLQRLAAEDDDEALSVYPPNLGAFHGFEDMTAFISLPPARMEEFFLAIEPADRERRNSVALGGAGVNTFRKVESLQHPLLDLLGVRYILAARTVQAPGLVDRTAAGTASPFRLYERTTCLPRATFVTRTVLVEDRPERLRLLADRDRDVAGEVILENPDAPRPSGAAGEASVQILEHRDDRVSLTVSNQAAGYLRLADPYDPGWTVTVNGEPREIYIADHYLRAVYLEPGEHDVEFRFDGTWVVWPERFSLLALAVIATLGFWPRKRVRG